MTARSCRIKCVARAHAYAMSCILTRSLEAWPSLAGIAPGAVIHSGQAGFQRYGLISVSPAEFRADQLILLPSAVQPSRRASVRVDARAAAW